MESPLHQIASSLSIENTSNGSSSSTASLGIPSVSSVSSVSSTSPGTTTVNSTAISASTTSPTYDWTKVYHRWNQADDTLEDSHHHHSANHTKHAFSSSSDELAWDTLLSTGLPSSSAPLPSATVDPLSMTCSHDHSAEQRIFNMSHKEKVTTCTYLKQIGNLYTLEGQYVYGIDRYRRGLVYYEYSFPENDQEQQEIDTIELQLLLNNSLAELRLHNYDKVINLVYQILAIDPCNIKALYRRSIAYRCIHEYDKAYTDIQQALTLLQERLNLKEGTEEGGAINEAKDAMLTSSGSSNRNPSSSYFSLRTLVLNELRILERYQQDYKYQEKRMAKYIVQCLGKGEPLVSLDAKDKGMVIASTSDGTATLSTITDDDGKEKGEKTEEEEDDNDNHHQLPVLLHYPTPSITSQLLNL